MSDRLSVSPKPAAKRRKVRNAATASACVVFAAVAWLAPGRKMNGSIPSFDLTATQKNFNLYFPAYLADGFFTTTTSLRGTNPTASYMVGLMDYTPGDVSRPAAIPSWAEIDYFDGHSWLNQTPVTPAAFRDYRQTLNMFDGRLETQYTWADAGRSTDIRG